MRLVSYLRSLLPKLDKRTVRDELRDLRGELNEYVLPSYDRARELLTTDRFSDDFVSEFEKAFHNEIRHRYRGNFIEVSYHIFSKLDKHLSTLEEAVDKHKGEEIVIGSITYHRAQILRLSELIYFVLRYSRRLLIYTLMRETELIRQDQPRGSLDLTEAQKQWLFSNHMAYIAGVRIFIKDDREFKKRLDEIPDLKFDEERVREHAATAGMSKLDPFGVAAQGFAPALNPIYHIRMRYEDWQNYRYENAKEDKRMVEYQIQDLKHALEQESNPRLEQALEYQRDRLVKIDRKIAKLEERAHGSG